MTDENKILLEFILRYQKNQDEKELALYFKRFKKFFNLGLYNDPSGILEKSDFENLAFIGFWRATLKYDQAKWDNPINWCYNLIKQQILKEIKKTYKKDKTIINSHMNPDLLIEDFSDIISDYQEITISQNLIEDIQFLSLKIEEVSAKANKVFQLKLIFPDISRTSISKILGFKRRNGLAKLVRIIRAVAQYNLNKESINYGHIYKNKK